MKYLVGLIIAMLTLNCNINSDDGAFDCLNVACTEEYRTITISIRDEEGNHVALGDFKVVVLEDGSDITPDVGSSDYDWWITNGVYPLFSDKYATKYRNRKLKIKFKGYIGGVQVVDSDYIVGADCCHVLLIKGETDLVISNL